MAVNNIAFPHDPKDFSDLSLPRKYYTSPEVPFGSSSFEISEADKQRINTAGKVAKIATNVLYILGALLITGSIVALTVLPVTNVVALSALAGITLGISPFLIRFVFNFHPLNTLYYFTPKDYFLADLQHGSIPDLIHANEATFEILEHYFPETRIQELKAYTITMLKMFELKEIAPDASFQEKRSQLLDACNELTSTEESREIAKQSLNVSTTTLFASHTYKFEVCLIPALHEVAGVDDLNGHNHVMLEHIRWATENGLSEEQLTALKAFCTHCVQLHERVKACTTEEELAPLLNEYNAALKPDLVQFKQSLDQ